MKEMFRSSLRLRMTNKRFALFLIVGCIVINLIIDLVIGWSFRQSQIQYDKNAQIVAGNLSNIMEQNIVTLLRVIDITLRSVADEAVRVNADNNASASPFKKYIQRQSDRIPEVLGLRVTDQYGNIIFTTNDPRSARINVGDREHFIRAKNNPNEELITEGPLLGRVSHEWILIVARRISRADGSFVGEVHASIAIATINKMFSTVDVGAKGVISIWDKNATILARYPDIVGGKSTIGTQKPSPQLKALLNADTGSSFYTATAPIDNIKRSYAIRKIGQYPFWVIAGLAESDYLAPWRTEVKQGLIAMLAFAIISSILTLLIYRYWRMESLVREKRIREEEQLRTQKLESLGILAGGIAHDFNNLLQGVFGYISLARITAKNPEKSMAALEQAEKALHQSVNLTTQLLTFAKGGKPDKKLIDLRMVIENAAKFTLSGSRSELRLNLPEDLWQAEADGGQLGQVLQNIVLNADQSMPVGGTIRVTAANLANGEASLPPGLAQGNYVMIAVQDAGVGIPEQYLTKIFDPYFTTKEKGSGLGLATSYSIVKNHGGMIDVRTKSGEGSTFLIYLPAIVGQVPAKAIEKQQMASQSSVAKVLVMDDEDFIRDLSSALLGELGHEVVVAKQGQEALEQYQGAIALGRPFDIVILDLTIRGGMGGVETVQELLKIDPHVKAVVSSGYSDDVASADYLSQGFKASLKKPYDVDALRNVISVMLRGESSSDILRPL